MPQITLSDAAYSSAQQAAVAHGLEVSAYVEALLQDDEDISYIFTPEVLAELDESAAEAKAGLTYTWDEVEQHLNKTRQTWLQARAR